MKKFKNNPAYYTLPSLQSLVSYGLPLCSGGAVFA